MNTSEQILKHVDLVEDRNGPTLLRLLMDQDGVRNLLKVVKDDG